MRPIIEVKNLSKVYQLGSIGATRLKDEVERLWDRVRGRQEAQKKGEFWALRDVSFEVQPGEVLGIIGRNGAGKSTLLKILSRITQQTRGEIALRGRMASLLEVGTGFHPDLTGRENIFLNGAILGMTRAEIRKKLDEIIAFAEVEKFINTPVKRYSSGMYVRLAFAVAAHLESEIMILDEVLSVGDAEFQRKCIGKMSEVSSQQGRTVLFVSHNMQAVATLCTRAVWLEAGAVHEIGATRALIDRYIAKFANNGTNENVPLGKKIRTGTGAAKFSGLSIRQASGRDKGSQRVVTGDSIELELEITSQNGIKAANVAVTIFDSNGVRLIDVNTALQGDFLALGPNEIAHVLFTLHDLLLKPGRYYVELWLGRGGISDIDFVKNAAVLEIHENLDQARHTETFPGIYQCRFSHTISTSAAV